MEIKELKELTEELIKLLREIGIPVSKNIKEIKINGRAKARLGACKKASSNMGKVEYTIEISSEILGCSKKEISEIIIHELLHTCKGCFNHGKKWKLYSEAVHAALGYTITRVSSYEKLGLEKPKEKEKIKYVIKCSGCGMEFPRKRICSLVKNPSKYRCGKCGNILYLQAENHNIL